MLFTLADAKTFCAPYVGNGLAETHPDVVTTINECSQLFMNRDKLWKHTVQKLRVALYNDSIALPYNVEAMLGATSEGVVRGIHGMSYEFLEGGPGALCDNSVNFTDFVDLGDGWPTFWPIGSSALRLVAFSTDADDVGKKIRVRGVDSKFMTISSSTPGELLSIQRWMDGVEGNIDYSGMVLSTNRFLDIESIIKDATTGYVTLLAYNDSDVTSVTQGHSHVTSLDVNGTGTTDVVDDHSHVVTTRTVAAATGTLSTSHTHDINTSVHVLSKYHPSETQPGYRRYKFTGVCGNMASPYCINLLVKMRYVPLVNDIDVLPIQNLMAYRWMCRAIHKFNEEEIDTGVGYQAMAEAELSMQTAAYELGNRQVVDFSVNGYAKGDAEDVI